MMNKVLFAALALVMLLLASCGTGNRLARAEREARIASQVEAALDARQYTIAVDWMRPLGGMPRHVNSDYELKVNGDEMDSYLPYVGEAYRLPYGGGKGLNFKAAIYNYTLLPSGDKCYLIEFDVENEEDVFHYRINVFTNGKAIIDVWARDRDSISFQGELVF
jgi:hypothetical protein